MTVEFHRTACHIGSLLALQHSLRRFSLTPCVVIKSPGDGSIQFGLQVTVGGQLIGKRPRVLQHSVIFLLRPHCQTRFTCTEARRPYRVLIASNNPIAKYSISTRTIQHRHDASQGSASFAIIQTDDSTSKNPSVIVMHVNELQTESGSKIQYQTNYLTFQCTVTPFASALDRISSTRPYHDRKPGVTYSNPTQDCMKKVDCTCGYTLKYHVLEEQRVTHTVDMLRTGEPQAMQAEWTRRYETLNPFLMFDDD